MIRTDLFLKEHKSTKYKAVMQNHSCHANPPTTADMSHFKKPKQHACVVLCSRTVHIHQMLKEIIAFEEEENTCVFFTHRAVQTSVLILYEVNGIWIGL